jgi:hypothetical protein
MSNHAHINLINQRAASCTDAGYSGDKYCEDCGTVLETGVEIPKLNHNAAPMVIENRKEATCTNYGSYEEVAYCVNCGVELSRTTYQIDMLSHNWSSNFTVDAAPSCMDTGRQSIRCLVCNAIKETQTIPANGHRWSEGVVSVEPSQDKEGIIISTCANCSANKITPIPKLAASTPQDADVNASAKMLMQADDQDSESVEPESDAAPIMEESGQASSNTQDSFVSAQSNISGKIALIASVVIMGLAGIWFIKKKTK